MAGNNVEGGFHEVGGNPVEEDDSRLIEKLPEEVWLLVFQCLEDPEDLKRVSNASLAFAKMLEGRRVEYLFPAVWDIIGPRLEEGGGNIQEKAGNVIPGRSSDEEVKESCYRFGSSDVLTLRVVCKWWKRGIDHFCYTLALPSELAGKNNQLSMEGPLRHLFSRAEHFQWDNRLIMEFLAHFRGTHEDAKSEFCPSPAKRISIEGPHVQDRGSQRSLENFEWTVGKALQIYGHQIQICQFKLNITTVRHDTTRNLRRWMTLLPNLTCLTIHCRDNNDYQFEPIHTLRGRDGNELARVMDPLPKLEKLAFLELIRAPPVVANLLLKTYNHVSVLHVNPEVPCNHVDVVTKPFPNLRDLTVTFYSMSDFEKLEEAQFSSGFKNLEITFQSMQELPSLPEVFALLARKWPTSLRRLKINVIPIFSATPESSGRVQRQINTLSRQYFPGLEDLDQGNLKRF